MLWFRWLFACFLCTRQWNGQYIKVLLISYFCYFEMMMLILKCQFCKLSPFKLVNHRSRSKCWMYQFLSTLQTLEEIFIFSLSELKRAFLITFCCRPSFQLSFLSSFHIFSYVGIIERIYTERGKHHHCCWRIFKPFLSFSGRKWLNSIF